MCDQHTFFKGAWGLEGYRQGDRQVVAKYNEKASCGSSFACGGLF